MTPGPARLPRTGRGVPLLVTVDVEIAYDRDVALQRAVLERLATEWAGLPAT